MNVATVGLDVAKNVFQPGFSRCPTPEDRLCGVTPYPASLRGLEPAPDAAETRVMTLGLRVGAGFGRPRPIVDAPRPSGGHRELIRATHAGSGGDRGRSRSMRRRIAANSALGTATSASWKTR